MAEGHVVSPERSDSPRAVGGRNQGRLGWTHPNTTTKAGGYANRNAGFIRQPQCGSRACRMNPAFRWWCRDARGLGKSMDLGWHPEPASVSLCLWFGSI